MIHIPVLVKPTLVFFKVIHSSYKKKWRVKLSILNIISASDFHIGHSKTSADVMHSNLKKYLYPQLTEDIDLFIISGDFFHTLLDMNSESGYRAALIIEELKKICFKNKIFLRVLRGTFTHDRHQNQFFNIETNEKRIGKDLAVRVFSQLKIEWIEELGISVLYVPDDLPYDEPLTQIIECISESPYDKVDIASMHCYFDHLLPRGIPRRPHNCYDADTISKYVNGPILNGHIHTKCVYKKIVTNGSFDRTAHGEEEDKGFFKLIYDTNSKEVIFDFIVNEGATLFKSIYLDNTKVTLDEFPNIVKDILNNNKSSSDRVFLRVVSDDSSIRESAHKFINTTYDNIVYSSKKLSNVSEEDSEGHIPSIEELPSITEDTLPSMVVDFIKHKMNMTISVDEVMKELKNC